MSRALYMYIDLYDTVQALFSLISQLNIWPTSLVVIVFLSMSKQMGHISSLWRLRGEIEISVPSVMASWGVRWSSYKLSSKKELRWYNFIIKANLFFEFHRTLCVSVT